VRFLIAAALLAALAGCRQYQPNTGSIKIDPELEALVPADTMFIMGANVDAIRNTPVYQKHIGIVELPRLNEFTKESGVDPRKDLWQVLSVSNGKTGILMARGKFNEGDLEPRLKKTGAVRFGYKGLNFWGDEQRNALVFIDSTTALTGSTAALKSIVDARNGGHHGLPAALAARMRAVPAESQIWAAFTGGVQGLNITVPEDSNLGNLLRVFKGLDSAVLGIDLRNGFDLYADALCKTGNDAKQVRAALKGIIGLGRLSTPDNKPDLLKLYDAIDVEQTQNKVTATAHIPPDLADRFVDMWVKKQ
jgi:hypothetical protein